MDAYVEDLEAVRQKLGLTKFAMLGDSFGGFIAMAYASAHPEHVAKLVPQIRRGRNYTNPSSQPRQTHSK